MSKSMSLTVPDKIHEALGREGQELEQDATEFLKSFLMLAYRLPSGAALNLRPAPEVLRPGEQELDLGLAGPAGGAGPASG